MTSGLLQYYFFPTDFYYPRPALSSTTVNVDSTTRKQQIGVSIVQTQKTEEPVEDHIHRNNNNNNNKVTKPICFSSSTTTTCKEERMEKQFKQGGCCGYGEKEGDFVGEESELTLLHLSCSVLVPDEFTVSLV
ncbi:hypothetical protein LOK49_LG12G02693 [Camellia lanceoleosa]|uniref:Uncharacterized protein n=1 Tax=Camellia lanceoleosa TaxID=1840588 RepID=A0ACC0FW93_9ERIC|nr:hypothetical protein LOK49_LG12G02693 [Camellia lanceoleosa]